MSFVHLHTHSHYSILEWLPKPSSYIKRAAELGMSAVALTDTGNLHGAFELYKYARDYNITPIIGAEIYTESTLPGVRHHKLVLLAKSNLGYKNLIEIVTYGQLYGVNSGIPIVSFDILKQFSEDIVCISGPISSEISYCILTGKSDKEVVERIQVYQSIFWKENYYLELLSHSDIPKQDLVTSRLIDIHKAFEVPVVAANNSYYIKKEDKNTQDVIMCLWTGHQVDNPDRPSLLSGDYSFLSEEEMQQLFGYLPSSLENTLHIAKQVSIKIKTGSSLMPKFELLWEDKELFEIYKNQEIQEAWLQSLHSDEFFLRYLCFQGMNWRYKSNFSQEDIFEYIKKKEAVWLTKTLQETEPDELRLISPNFYTSKKKELLSQLDTNIQLKIDRLEYELFVVHEMGFDAYFLIVSDYINWARKNNIPVGPWRGSAAWALLAYLTWITDIDPLTFDLLFERFLNPARVSMPDIDTDFSDDGRDRVVDYCRQRYGEERVAQICTFGTFAARAAFKDVWRVRWIPFAEMNEVAKFIPEKPGTKLAGALETSPEFKNLYQSSQKFATIIDDALKIEWNVRQIWVHACAVIIAPEDMRHFTALQHPPKDQSVTVTQYDAKPLEDIGLLKMDFLWLRNLTIIQRTLEIIEAVKGIKIDILDIPLDDQKVFDVFALGDTTWVFQFESDGMRTWLKSLKPTDINDIIAMVSLYRPGPMQFIQYYIDRKYGKEKVEYMYEELEKVVEKKYGKEVVADERKKLFEDLGPFMDITYGISVYQEQLMRLVQAMAWFSLAEADMLRRWVWKKKKDVVEKIKGEFITKAASFRWYKPETSDYIYEKMIMPAADYSFNKSHAACYAFIAYETAFLKAYYPTEFLTSLMTSDEEDTERIALEVDEVRLKWIELLPPSVNASLKHFTYINDSQIRFWLKAIKWLWDGPIDKILEARKELQWKPFASLDEFMTLVWKEVMNKKALESLIKSWSLDDLGERSTLLENVDNMIRFSRQKDQKKETSQIGLFDMGGWQDEWLHLISAKKLPFEQILFYEAEVLGFMVSGHPLDGLKPYINARTSWVQSLKIPMETLKAQFEKLQTEEQKKKFLEWLRQGCKCIGVIRNFRKILTKWGENMMFIECESFDFDFEVTIYDRDYLTYANDIQIWKVILMEDGMTQVDPQYGRKTIIARKMRILLLTQIREQAKEKNLVNWEKRRKEVVHLAVDKVDISETSPSLSPEWDGDVLPEDALTYEQNSKMEPSYEYGQQDTEGNIHLVDEIISSEYQDGEREYIIFIPLTTSKQLLLDLKEFLENEKPWDTKIWIDFKWQKIDTKISVSHLERVLAWEKENLI